MGPDRKRVGRARRASDARPIVRLLRFVAVLYLLALVILAVLVYGPGERFWPVTLFLFGPRWVVTLPLVVLIPLAAVVDRRLLVLMMLVTGALATPLFGINLPWGLLRGSQPADHAVKVSVATWNVGGGGVSRTDVEAFLISEAPDVLALQECRPDLLDQRGGWHRHRDGRMGVLSRFPIKEALVRDPKDMWALAGSGAIVRYVLETPAGSMELTNVHLETPREGIEALVGSGLEGVPVLKAKNEQRDMEHRLARRWVDASATQRQLVVGDFNTPVESHLFREHWGGFQDCHSRVGWGFGFTKRTRRIGVRIDHVLAGPGWQCIVSRTVRGFGGDHLPLIADLSPVVGS